MAGLRRGDRHGGSGWSAGMRTAVWDEGEEEEEEKEEEEAKRRRRGAAGAATRRTGEAERGAGGGPPRGRAAEGTSGACHVSATTSLIPPSGALTGGDGEDGECVSGWHRDISQAIVVTDMTGCITHWNEAASQLFGWPPEGAIGKYRSNLIPALHADLEEERAMEVFEHLRRGRPWAGEYSVHSRHRGNIQVMGTDMPLLDSRGALVGIAEALCDVSAGRVLEEKIESLNSQIRQITGELLAVCQKANRTGTRIALEIMESSFSTRERIKSVLAWDRREQMKVLHHAQLAVLLDSRWEFDQIRFRREGSESSATDAGLSRGPTPDSRT